MYSEYLTHEEVRQLRKDWSDLYPNINNEQEQIEYLRSLSGQRWAIIIKEFNTKKEKIHKTPISANIIQELSDLKKISIVITHIIQTFKHEISILRSKNTDIVDDIISKLLSDGDFSYTAIQMAKEEFYKNTSTNYAIIFNTERSIGECIESMSSWDISKILKDVEFDIKTLASTYHNNLLCNI